MVAVTTATEDGVATPSMGPGAGGVTGGGLLPAGGGADVELASAPHPEIDSRTMHVDVMKRERMDEDPPSRMCCGFAASGRKPSKQEDRRATALP